MEGWTSYELPGQGLVNEAAVNPRNGYVTEYYREKVFLRGQQPFPPRKEADFVAEGVQDGDIVVECTTGITYTVDMHPSSHAYRDAYENKAWTPYPAEYYDWSSPDWYYECKAEAEEPAPREPYVKARKGRRGWNQPRPHQHRHQHHPRMNYKRRRRHG